MVYNCSILFFSIFGNKIAYKIEFRLGSLFWLTTNHRHRNIRQLVTLVFASTKQKKVNTPVQLIFFLFNMGPELTGWFYPRLR